MRKKTRSNLNKVPQSLIPQLRDGGYETAKWSLMNSLILYADVVQLVERQISNLNVCEFEPRHPLHEG